MFERYTEKARRVIFYARYEASMFGSPYIETEHLLLGLLREDFHTVDTLIPGAISVERMREANLAVDRDDHKLTPKEAAALLASSLEAHK